jgi:hypothetical protein
MIYVSLNDLYIYTGAFLFNDFNSFQVNFLVARQVISPFFLPVKCRLFTISRIRTNCVKIPSRYLPESKRKNEIMYFRNQRDMVYEDSCYTIWKKYCYSIFNNKKFLLTNGPKQLSDCCLTSNEHCFQLYHGENMLLFYEMMMMMMMISTLYYTTWDGFL